MKKLIAIIAFLTLSLFARPQIAFAEDETCVTVYGGGVVCGAAHEAVDTAISINPAVLGTGLLLASKGFSILSKKLKEDPSNQE